MIDTYYEGNLQSPYAKQLGGSTAEDIGSAAVANGFTVAGFQFVNPTGGAVTCSLYYNDGSTDILVWSGSVASNETAPAANITHPIRLPKGGKIRAKGANTVWVVLYFSMSSQMAAMLR